MCKRREAFSLRVLIGRGLIPYIVIIYENYRLLVFRYSILKELEIHPREGVKLAPLAQLVEHLTLNQGVHGSSP